VTVPTKPGAFREIELIDGTTIGHPVAWTLIAGSEMIFPEAESS
jgi:hypothetical protein